jgi:hypothetical protein
MSFGTAFALPSTAWQRGGGPSLALDFLTGSLPSGVTYTRAASTGTYVGSNGFVQNAVADTARFDYDPASFVYQNLLNNSTSGFLNGANVTITTNATTAPDGTNTAVRITSGPVAISYAILQIQNSGQNLQKVSAAIYLKPTGVDRGAAVVITNESVGGDVTNIIITSLATGGTDVGNGWRRYVVPVGNNYDGQTLTLRVYPDRNSGNLGPNSSIYAWGPQVNSTATPTAYYATSGTAYSQASIKGLLIEETRTNSIIQSSVYSNAAWTKTGLSSAIISYAPDNAFTAELLTGDIDGTTIARFVIPATLPLTPTISSPYTMSMYFKYINTDNTIYTAAQWMQMAFSTGGFGATAYLNIDIINGVLGTVGAGITSSSITNAGNGWWRVTATASATAAVASGVQVYFANTTSSVRGDPTFSQSGSQLCALAWGTQLEAGNVATSFIPTTTVAVTRNADSAVLTTLTPWYNTTEGTLYTAFSVKGYNVGVFNAAAGFSDNTTTNFIVNRVNPATQGNYIVRVAGVDQANVVSSGTTTANTTIKIASTYKANDFAMSLNGGTVVTDTSGTVPTVSRLVLGATGTVGTNPLNGWLATVNFYNTRLPNATLQSITT